MALFQLFGETLVPLLRFEREAILTGEYWRLVSGHAVHLSWPHLLLNLAGLAFVYVLGARRLNFATWWLTGIFSALLIDAGFLFWTPKLQWYAGLSGVLHAWFVVCVIVLWRECGWRTGAPFLALLAAKLAWELGNGPLPGTTELVGGRVVVEAHLFGALGGVVSAAAMETSRRIARRAGQA